MARILLILAAVMAALAVMTGAFAAHGLADLPDHQMEWWQTGARYHIYHAFGMFIAAFVLMHLHARLAVAAGWLFLVGIVLFSGSLYFMAVSEWITGTEQRWLGAITPFGGLAFILGWIILAVAAARKSSTQQT